MSDGKKVLILCGGLQSSGSTLVSWCFLQHPEVDGILDAPHDLLWTPESRRLISWCKFTICSFRVSELETHYRDEGFEVRGLLVVRDVRSVFRSLMGKEWGKNGLTAEDPPLRMRFLRFKEDWLRFRERGGVLLRYESLLSRPEETLREAATGLGLPWSADLVNWPKAKEDVSGFVCGNPTFHQHRGTNLLASLRPEMGVVQTGGIPPEDLDWLESEFLEFNRAHGYVEAAPRTEISPQALPRLRPAAGLSRRMEWERQALALGNERDLWKANYLRLASSFPVRPMLWLRRTIMGKASPRGDSA